jgi:hypothetical protein
VSVLSPLLLETLGRGQPVVWEVTSVKPEGFR